MAYAKAGKYLQRSVRIDGRVSTEYYGSGPFASDLATMDLLIRQEREAERRERREREAEQSALLAEEMGRGRALRQVVAICLSGLGFVRYARNPWRKRMLPRPSTRRGDVSEPDRAEIRTLIKRTEAKEPGAFKELSRLAESHPAIVADETGANLGWLARAAFIDSAFGGRAEYELGIETQMDMMLRELAGPNPSPALKLVSEAVVFAWAEHWVHSTVVSKMGIQKTVPIQLKRQQAAFRRYMSALKTYSQIKSLENRYGTFSNL